MENLLINRAYRIFVSFTFCILFLLACQSTPDESAPDCRTETSENCSAEEDNGDDRGYNPCLVNKNLPVCKK